MSDLRSVAAQAEQDLNTYQSKTGNARGRNTDDVGIDTRAEKKFPGAHVAHHPDMSTNAGYDRRIPADEGGQLDDRGRESRGRHFEGPGGPRDKAHLAQDERGGDDDNDVFPELPETKERHGKEALDEGADAARANAGQTGVGAKFKGQDYYRPEDVPDSIAAQGNIPPSSVTQASKETEGFY